MGYINNKFFDPTKWKHGSAVGDGSTTNYNLSAEPISVLEITVTLNGIVQRPTTDFTLSGTTVSFVSAPALAQDIDIFYLVE